MANAQIKLSNGKSKMNFCFKCWVELTYSLKFKDKEVIKPTKLGLELKNDKIFYWMIFFLCERKRLRLMKLGIGFREVSK
jgi:hypothetical protein